LRGALDWRKASENVEREIVMLQEIVMSNPERSAGSNSRGGALRRRTGRDREGWFALLDAWGAGGRPYREIADWLMNENGLSGWWAQKLIVEYEEARGIRQQGVRRDGTFEVGASKTVGVTAEQALEAFIDPAVRERWLPGAKMQEIEREPRRARFDWKDGTSRVTVAVSSTDIRKSLVAVQHDRLRDAAVAQTTKAYWRERLTALKELLES
jgi:hypothetical protein